MDLKKIIVDNVEKIDLKKLVPDKLDLKKILPEKIDFTGFASDLVATLNAKFEETGHFNILITGKTGVGKSTLINAVFRDKLAETGIGAPVTDEIKVITKKGVPIRIYDTVGLELDTEKQKKVMAEISQLINNAKDMSIFENIHCIWYCVNVNSSRLEPVEAEFINQLAATGVPVIIVLTKAFSATETKDLKRYIEGINLNAKGICPVLAESYSGSGINVRAYGKVALINLTHLVIPDDVKEALEAAQVADLSLKRKKANYFISTAVGLAAAQCVNPIPLSDAPILTKIQLSMMASITYVYGATLEKNDIAKILTIMISTQGVKVAGITLANFLKSFVGVGTVAGGAINMMVATSLTATLGKTYAYIIEEIIGNRLDVENFDKKKWKDSINKAMKKINSNQTLFEFEGAE